MLTASFFIIVIGLWMIYSGWRFYKQVNWDEEPVSTPDYGAMRKREAELRHIQELLQEEHAQGKLSAGFLEEYNRFCEKEVAELRSATLQADGPKQSGPNASSSLRM